MDGNNFLLWDSKDDDEEDEEEDPRIIMFGSERCVQFLGRSPHWFFDSTFKTAPHLFFEVLMLHVLLGWRTLACVFVLMPNKTEETYYRVFGKLRAMYPEFRPETVMSDFEVAAMNAFRGAYPESSITGCFFHLS